MILNKIEDPRDNLAKARLWELQQFAEANNVPEVKPDMPAILVRSILRSKGLTQIPVPNRPLGQMNQPNPRPMYKNGLAVPPERPRAQPEQPQGIEADAEVDLARQYRTKKPARPPRLVERPKSEINKLRDECKHLRIKMDRRDRMPDLKAKIAKHWEFQKARFGQHGQDAAQRDE